MPLDLAQLPAGYSMLPTLYKVELEHGETRRRFIGESAISEQNALNAAIMKVREHEDERTTAIQL